VNLKREAQLKKQLRIAEEINWKPTELKHKVIEFEENLQEVFYGKKPSLYEQYAKFRAGKNVHK
jgi:hypothetical protein